MLSDNRSLASEGEPLLIQSAGLESLKTIYAESGSTSLTHLQEAGDAYAGAKSREARLLEVKLGVG